MVFFHVDGGRLAEGVGHSGAGDKASAATESEILETPLDENLDAALELNNVHKMDEQPDEPGEDTGDVQTENVGDSGGAPDHSHVSFIEIVERRNGGLPCQARFDCFGDVASPLNGDLGDAREWLAVLVEGKREIADDKNIGIVGNAEIALQPDAAAAIGFGVSALGDSAAEVVCGNSSGPEDGAGWEFASLATVSVVDAVSVDIVYHGVCEDFDAKAGDKLFRFG